MNENIWFVTYQQKINYYELFDFSTIIIARQILSGYQ